ncbi:MAG: shikimate dehydrogenase [Pseudomonadota bacterium]
MTAVPTLAGVIGWPIAHSRSPRLHGHWLRQYSIDGHYIPLALPPERFSAGLTALQTLGFRGANVTLPHKTAALAQAARASDRARRIGAANTLTFLPNGGFEADNTDCYGFLESLRAAQPDWRADTGPALVLGAGGAARAVVDALLDAGAPVLRIANRSPERIAALQADFGPRIEPTRWPVEPESLRDVATLVNTTTCGMNGQNDLALALDAATAACVVVDLVYTPLETGLLREAKAHELAAVDGLGMLLHQAVPGFEAWFGRRPVVDAALRAAVLGA